MTVVRALLLTDVVDSTALVERLGDARAATVWRAHDRVARDLLPAHHGLEIDKTDGFLLLFESAAHAVQYAVAYHQGLAELSASLDVPLTARAGLHVGEVVLHENTAEDVARGAKPLEVEGIAKPTAARVMSIARGRQTLLTDDARAALPEDLGSLRTVSHGHWRLKGVAQPVELFEVGEQTALFEPPPDAAKAYRVLRDGEHWLPRTELPGNLGPAPDRLFGRASELAELAGHLEAGAALVTLTGPAGIGKTRLAEHYGRSWAGSWPGGCWRLAASELRTEEALRGAVDALVGGAVEELCTDGRDRLLIVDAPGAGEALAHLLALPRVRLVVTSRQPLGLPAERTIPLSELGPEDAAALFRDRAGQRVADRLDGGHVARVVRELRGVPQTIERAAARACGTEDRPFKGLSSFGPEDAELFFGRDEEARDLAEQLRAHSLVTVTGVSGAGKTSLIQAGVLRHMAEQVVVVMRPGSGPMVALLAALEEHAPDRVHAVRHATYGAGDAPSVDRNLLLVVDQAEELLTLTQEAAERERFGAALGALTALPRTHVAFSVREDFFARLADVSSLRGHYNRSVAVVTRPARPQLLETLTRPAALFGHVFEEGLAEEMVETVADEPAALALLQFCADQLWSQRAPDTLRLTRAAYLAVNGVEGAMASHADRVFDALSTAQQVEGRRLLQRLVTAKLTKEPRRRADLLESAPDQERGRFVLHRLTEARLLRVYQADDGSPMVEVAHEALLRHWQRLEDWMGEDESEQRMLRSLGHAARLWDHAGRASDLLWRGNTLLAYGLWRQGSDAVLTSLEAAFAEASQAAGRRARRQRRGLLGLVVAAVAAVAVGSTWLWLGAEKARGEAVTAHEASLRSLAQAETGTLINAARLAEAGGESATALRLTVEAFERAPDVSRAREALYQLLLRRREALLLQSDLDAVGWTVPPWSPDGTRFVVGRGDEVSLLDGAGAPVAVLDGEPGWFAKVVWSPDSRAFATFEGGIRIWGADGELLGGPLSVEGVPAWTPDSSNLLVRSWSRAERSGWITVVGPTGDIAGEVGRGDTPIWERSGSPTDSRILLTRATGVFVHARSGEVLVDHRQDGCQPLSTRWHPDGTRVGALWGCASGPGFVATFSSRTGEELQRWPIPRASAQIEWSPTGEHLLVMGEEEFAIRGPDGGTFSLPSYCSPTVASWGPDGERVLVPCFRGDAFVYSRSGEQRGVMGENRHDMRSDGVSETLRVAGWLGDGARVATQDAGNTIAAWAADGSSAQGPSAETGAVLECSWHPSGELFATTADDGTVRVWDRDGALRARIGEPWASLPRGFPADVMPRIAWDPTSPRLVVARADDAVRIWAGEGPPVDLADDPGSIGLLDWSPDGEKIALVSGNRAVVFALDGSTRYPLELERRVEYLSGSFGAGWNAASTHLIMAGHTGAPVLWDAQGHRTDLIWNGSGGLDWHPSGDRFYISDGFRADAPISRVYDLQGQVLSERSGVIRSTWDPKGELWIFTTRAGDVLAREDDTVVAPLPYRSRMRVITWSPKGSWFLGLVYGDAGVLWGRDGERRAVLQLQGEDGAVCFDPEEELLSAGVGTDVVHLPLADEALLARVRSIAPQPFVAADTAQYLH